MKPARILTCGLLAVISVCLVLALAGFGWLQMSQDVEARFGPPAPGLSLMNRITLTVSLYFQQDMLLRSPLPGAPTQDFVIASGEAAAAISGRLWDNGLISDPTVFRQYLTYSGLDTALQAGRFELSAGMTMLEIAAEIQDATSGTVTFNVLPGWRLEEIAAALPTSGLDIAPDEFLQIASLPPAASALTSELPPYADVEGFLLPGVYEFSRQTSAIFVINTMMDTFSTAITAEMRAGFQQQNLTLYQAVTLASIVEREAVIDDEKPLIASVFLNRLAQGMRLDADPTVQYAVGGINGRAWWPVPLTLDDLAFVSPYNTYTVTGLPPGPIANPSLLALNAVAFPAQTPYYYFQAACDGSGRHNFAVTYEEHLLNSCR